MTDLRDATPQATASVIAFPKEELRAELGEDGLWHARYPSATKTLCGVDVETVKQPRGWPEVPDCGPCSKTARKFDRIDRSMPDRWRRAA